MAETDTERAEGAGGVVVVVVVVVMVEGPERGGEGTAAAGGVSRGFFSCRGKTRATEKQSSFFF